MVRKATEDVREGLFARFKGLLAKCDAGIHKRLGIIDSDLLSLRSEVNTLADQSKIEFEKIAELERKMPTAQSAQVEALEALEDEAFDRPIDETLFEINCSEFAEKIKLLEQLVPWLEEANVDSAAYVLKGAPVGKRFQLQFLGAP